MSEVTSVPTRRRSLLRLLPVLAMVAVMLPLAGEAASAQTMDAYCRSNVRTKVDLFLDHAEVGAELRRIERGSQGRVETGVAGYTFNGRAIHTARVGTGDTVVLIQSEIHGNEKHGTPALINVLEQLGADNPRAAEIREAITVVGMPMFNADGGELNQRRNDMSRADVISLHPQLADAPNAWYFSAGQGGFDVNRDFNADLDYTPRAEDLPGRSDRAGFFITPTAQASRDVYQSLENEFGQVDYFLDLHGQAACYRWGTSSQQPDPNLTYLSLSGEIVDESRAAEWPTLDLDKGRRATLAIHDALQTGGQHHLSRTSLYPDVDLPGTALGAYQLRGSASVLFETSGQTQQIGHHRMPFLVRQVEIGVMGLIDSVTDGTIDDIDPSRYRDIEVRGRWTGN